MNLTWLKKAGAEALKIGQVVLGIQPYMNTAGQVIGGVAPSLLGTVTKVETELSQFMGVVTDVEAMGQAITASGNTITGPQKLAAAIPQIGQVVASSAAMVGKKIANPTLYAQAMQEYAQATADLANSLEASTITSVPTA